MAPRRSDRWKRRADRFSAAAAAAAASTGDKGVRELDVCYRCIRIHVGVALAMRHTLQSFIRLRAHGLRKGDEHLADTPRSTLYHYLLRVRYSHDASLV